MQSILGLAIGAAFILVIIRLVSSGKTRIEPVLIIFGILMMIIAEVLGIGTVFGAGKGTGLRVFDAFEYMSFYLDKNFMNTSGAIMVIFGYVMYCDAIEANQCLAKLLTDPLKKLKSPYMLLPFCVVISMSLSLFIGTATGLSAMIMATIAPMLTGVGISKKAASSVACMAYAIPLGLGAPVFLAGTTALGLKGSEVTVFWAQYLLPAGLLAIVACGIVQLFAQRRLDEKDKLIETEQSDKSNQNSFSAAQINLENIKAPKWYAIFAVLPCVLLLVFSPFFIKSITISLNTAFIISLVLAVICDSVRVGSLSAGFNKFKYWLDGVGNAVSNVCLLIMACAVFVNGLICLGVVKTVINYSQSLAVTGVTMTIIFSAVILGITIIMGSGNAAYFAFVPIAVSTCSQLGIDPKPMVITLYFVSNLARSYSPVAGATICTAGMANLSPMAVIRRNIVPVAVALVLAIILPLSIKF